MRCIGIDYGEKRIGLAYSEPGTHIAFPLQDVENTKKVVAYIAEIIKEREVDHVVLGASVTPSGTENPAMVAIREFAKKIEEATGVPVAFEPEFDSSREAARFAPAGSSKVEAAAAAIILQRFLDRNSGGQ